MGQWYGNKVLPTLPNEYLLKYFASPSNYSATLSNVAGPRVMVSMFGKVVQDMTFYAYAPIGLYLGLISYAGKVSVSIVSDSDIMTDANELGKHWRPEFDALRAEVYHRN